MSDVTVKQIEELDRYQGELLPGQQFYFAGKSLGVGSWGMNILDMPANWQDYPEHDHEADGQEEVYVCLSGSGTLHAEGGTWHLDPGGIARVGKATKRRIVPGPDGMRVLALGGVPGKAYELPAWQQ